MYRKSMGGLGGGKAAATPSGAQKSARKPMTASRIPQPGGSVLSSRKEVPGSSARRVSASGGRMSVGGERLSTYGVARGVKDERPLSLKSYQNEMVAKIFNYLNGTEGVAFTEKQIRQPTRNDFKNMFEALYGCMDPAFRLSHAKLEVEVPALLKDLGYPYQIPSSTFQSIGASHTWPKILGALAWLVDLLIFTADFSVERHLFQSFEGAEDDGHDPHAMTKLTYTLMCASTEPTIMEGGVMVSVDPDAWLEEQLFGDSGALETASRELESKIATAKDRLDALYDEKERDAALGLEVDGLERDYDKKNAYLRLTDEFLQQVEGQTRAVQLELDHQTRLKHQLTAKLAETEALIASQPMSASEVATVLRKRDWLLAAVGEKTAQVEANRERILKAESGLVHLQREIRAEHDSIVGLMRAVLAAVPTGLISEDAVAHLPLDMSPFDPAFSRAWTETLRPPIAALERQLRERREALKTAILEEKKALRSVRAQQESTDVQTAGVAKACEATGREQSRVQELRQAESARLTAEAERRAEELKALTATASLGVQDQHKALAKATAEKKAKERELTAALDAARERVTGLLLSYEEEFNAFKEQKAATRAAYKGILDTLREADADDPEDPSAVH